MQQRRFAQFLMTECNCAEADFTNTWFSETDFSGGNFNGAIFCKTLIDVNFWDADISGADFSYAFFRCSPRELIATRGIDTTKANFTGAVFFVPRASSPEDLNSSAIQGAVCINSKADMENLNLDEYHELAVEQMLEEFTPA
jgi:uncharacterized protein YjbI with pentapeptide repeats